MVWEVVRHSGTGLDR